MDVARKLIISIVWISCAVAACPADARTDAIPPAPDIGIFQFEQGSVFNCGIKFYLKSDDGKTDIVIFTTEEGKIFVIFTGDGRSFQMWIDSDLDGTYEEYFEGSEGFADVQKVYPTPCDILKKHFL